MALVYQIGRRGARLRTKSFWGAEKCCQCGNVASSNVANGQWGGRGGPLGFAGMEARHPE